MFSDDEFIAKAALVFISVCIAGVVYLAFKYPKHTAVDRTVEESFDNNSRLNGGTGIGFGIDVGSGNIKLGYGVGPVNIINL